MTMRVLRVLLAATLVAGCCLSIMSASAAQAPPSDDAISPATPAAAYEESPRAAAGSVSEPSAKVDRFGQAVTEEKEVYLDSE